MSNLYNSKTNTVNWEELEKIPEFQELKKTHQNILWHKEGDAFVHTCTVTQCMLNHINIEDNAIYLDEGYRKILVYSALLHDIGKTVTTKRDEVDGLYHCKNHAIEGVKIAEHILDTYISDIDDIFKKSILSLVRYHMQPLYILDKKDPKSAILKLANNLKYIDFESLLLLKQCDCDGAIAKNPINYQEVLEGVRKLYYEVCTYPAGTAVVLEKEQDFLNGHPNDINKGYTISGNLYAPVTVGYRTYIGRGFSTSPVIKIIDKNHFQTKNSIYKITKAI